MALRNTQPETFRAHGLSDALDASNAFAGAMRSLRNLVPSTATPGNFVCRPAAGQIGAINSGTFGGTTARVVCMIQVGNLIFGMVQCTSGTFAGLDLPFVFDPVNNLQVGINIGITMGAGSLPTTQSNNFGWNPPMMAIISTQRVMIAHSGFNGTTRFVGWFDISNYSNITLTCTTHAGTNVLDTWSASPLAAGVRPGMKISGGTIPANAVVDTVTATTVTMNVNAGGGAAAVPITVTGGTPTVPIYYAGQTGGQPLAATALGVASFNGRCYYAVNNGVQFSDALDPLQITNASQALVLGDNSAVNCLAPIPLSSPITGGVIQSLIAFKSAQPPWQITGDPATNNLATNQIAGGIGTLAPRSVQPTTHGLAYIAPDGLRTINADGHISSVIGDQGSGVTVPFKNAVNPSRIAAAFNVSIYRVSVVNGAQGQAWQEYWYDFDKNIWTGAHSCANSTIIAYTASASGSLINQPLGNGTGFVFFSETGNAAALYLSLPYPSSASSFTEFGSPMNYIWQSCLMPDNQHGAMNCMVESALAVQLPAAATVTASVYNEENIALATPLGAVVITGAAPGALREFGMPWALPLVFKQCTLALTGSSANALEIGNFYPKIAPLGYNLASPYA